MTDILHARGSCSLHTPCQPPKSWSPVPPDVPHLWLLMEATGEGSGAAGGAKRGPNQLKTCKLAASWTLFPSHQAPHLQPKCDQHTLGCTITRAFQNGAHHHLAQSPPPAGADLVESMVRHVRGFKMLQVPPPILKTHQISGTAST